MKRFYLISLALMLVCTCALATTDAVVDNADLLSDRQEAALEEKCQEIYDLYDFQVVFVTTYGTGGQPIHMYAADFYDYNGYGYGPTCDGIIFVVDMQEREYVTVTTGRGINYFSDFAIEMVEDEAVPYLSEGDYAAAFETYLSEVGMQLEYVLGVDEVIFDMPDYEGEVVAAYEYYGSSSVSDTEVNLIIAAGVAAVVTLIVMVASIASMKTGRKQVMAEEYIGNVNICRQTDTFLYTTEKRERIESDSSSSSGGSSTFSGSSGTSHGGGRSGKF